MTIIPAWVEGGIVGFRNNNSKRPNALFTSTANPPGRTSPTDPHDGFCMGEWHDLDLRTKCDLPEDCIGVFLQGLMIITAGYAPITANVHAGFRVPGDDLTPDSYQIQAMEGLPAPYGGVRSTVALAIPVKDGITQFRWDYAGTGCYPASAAYAINLALGFYVRPSPFAAQIAALETRIAALEAA